MSVYLSKGALKSILNKGLHVHKPTFKLLGYIKQLDPFNDRMSFRLIVSDGETATSLIILAENLSRHIILNHWSKNTIFEVKKYTLIQFKNGFQIRYMMYIRELKVLIPGRNFETTLGKVNLKKVKCEEILTSIADLIPDYKRWFVRGQVIKKSPLITQSNFLSEESFFTFYLRDERGEIRCRMLNSQAEKLYETIEEGKFYYIFQCLPKTLRKTLENFHNNNYEIILSNHSKILKCDETSNQIVTFDYIYNLTDNSYKKIDSICPKSLIGSICKPFIICLSIIALSGFSISFIDNFFRHNKC